MKPFHKDALGSRQTIRMMRGVLVLFLVLVGVPSVAQAPNDKDADEEYSQQIRELEGLLKRSQKLLKEDQAKEALEAAQEAYLKYQKLPPTLGRGVFGRGNALSLMGQACAKFGNHELALTHWEQAVACYKLVRGSDENHAVTLEKMAASLQALEKVEEATDTLDTAAELHQQARQVENAIAARLAALRLIQQLPDTPESRKKRVSLLFNTGTLYHGLGQPEKAADCFRSALAVCEEISVADSVLAATLRGLAAALVELDMLDDALGYFNRELKLYAGKKDETVSLARAHHNIGVVHERQKRAADAAKAYRMAAQSYEQEKHISNAADEWLAAGKVAHKSKLYLQAKDYLAKALDLYERGSGTEQWQKECLEGLAVVASALGKWEDSHTHLSKQLAILQSEGKREEDQAHALRNLGKALKKLSREKEAYQAYVKSLSIYEELPGTEAERADALYNVGSLLGAAADRSFEGNRTNDFNGNWTNALVAFTAAIALYDKTVKSEKYHRDNHASSLAMKAILLFNKGRHREAADLFDRALTLVQGLEHAQKFCADNRWFLGKALEKQDRVDEAKAHLELGFAERLRLEFPFLHLMENEKRSEVIRTLESDAQYLYYLALDKTPAMAKLAFQAAQAAQSAEFQRIEHSLWRASSGVSNSADLEQLCGLRSLIARRILMQISEYYKEFDPTGEELTLLAKELRSLEVSFSQGVTNATTPVALEIPSPADVLQALGPGQILVQYVSCDALGVKRGGGNEDEPFYGAFVASGDRKTVVPIRIGPSKETDATISAFVELFEAQINPSRFNLSEDALAEQGQAVHRLLLDPILSRLGKPKRLYVVPTRMISILPFEALAQKDPSARWRYLVEDVEVIYLNNARDLKRLQTPAKESDGKETWIMANPDFSATVGTRLGRKSLDAATKGRKVEPEVIPANWLPLERTRDLAAAVAQRIRAAGIQCKVFSGLDASEETLARTHSPWVFLLATHGYFMREVAPVTALTWESEEGKPGRWGDVYKLSSDPMMRSMLILAGANDRNHRISTVRPDANHKKATPQPIAETKPLDAMRHELSDGLLTAYEVMNLDLQATALVVLVGCESGMGVPRGGAVKGGTLVMNELGLKVQGGSFGGITPALTDLTEESFTGLRRAFLIAGTRSIVSSLWTLPDRPALQLIDDFFDEWLVKKQPRYPAFRTAQLKALQRARQNGNSHPLYWSGFVYSGDPGDLPPLR